VNLCGTTLLTAKNTISNRTFALCQINYLQALIIPSDLRLLDEAQLPQLAQELRNFIIDVVSVKKDISAPV
jgi:hypothetical protein